MLRKNKVWLTVAAGAVIVIAVSWFGFRKHEGPRVQAHHPVVAPLTETILASGRVVQERESALGVTVQGTVAEVLVEQGDEVEENQLLLRLADDEAAARAAEAEAAVQQATAALEAVQGLGRKLAAQALSQANADEAEARKDVERQQGLFERGAVTEVELEHARHALVTSQNRRVQARLELTASAPKGSRVAEAAAALARAQAALRSAQVAFSRTKLRAPGAGTVLQRDVERGEVVAPGQVLFTFAERGKLSVAIHPDETSLGKLKVGQSAVVSPEAFPKRRIEASVSRIAPSVNAEQGTIDVEIALRDSSDLRPEMTVSVEIVVARKDDALVLPTRFIRDLASAQPWVLESKGGRATRTAIEIGLRGEQLVEVAKGLSETSAVLAPETSVLEGDPVRTHTALAAVSP